MYHDTNMKGGDRVSEVLKYPPDQLKTFVFPLMPLPSIDEVFWPQSIVGSINASHHYPEREASP